MPLYAFGSNGSGQLGIGHDDDVSVPTRCLFDGPEPDALRNGGERTTNVVRRIAAGGNHTLLLFSDGSVYAAGWNGDGRCGGRACEGVVRFRRVVVGDGVSFKDVSAGWEGSFLVSTGDEVFVMGSGARGELGLGEGVVQATVARAMGGFPRGMNVVAIASGMGHAVVVLSSGEVFGWGGARKGQLGESVRGRRIVWSPVRISDVPFRATGAVCGREFTVVMGDKEKGEFVVLGSADHRWNVLSDIPVLGGYRYMAASWHGVYVHRAGGEVLAWGRNDRGQLPSEDLPVVRELAVGSEHVLALLDGGRLVAFGWGEHGNCGPVVDEQGNVRGRYNLIPLPLEGESDVVGVGAGCATSWVVIS
ncbi:regulator of chromosome condensation 1/beta-lactamase-inhibitor protein II [Aspergillus coremiiformis]|uniref:Regulator of chromosome condensation 1/beta-lactamase-inhibitor protein II n=1 Tax=Aspergillus coremiiformis TaxID=138285 RepID=A0A5N6Z094_9EURO|nr:regulator of chromosome condensation 1/beta-lactamase-inhibitor protein II [Aspergillus coremiiformis]